MIRIPAGFAKSLLSNAVAAVCALGLISSAIAQEWQPEILSDGQPNITGMWNHVRATATPVELPDERARARVPQLAGFGAPAVGFSQKIYLSSSLNCVSARCEWESQ